MKKYLIILTLLVACEHATVERHETPQSTRLADEYIQQEPLESLSKEELINIINRNQQELVLLGVTSNSKKPTVVKPPNYKGKSEVVEGVVDYSKMTLNAFPEKFKILKLAERDYRIQYPDGEIVDYKYKSAEYCQKKIYELAQAKRDWWISNNIN